MKSNKEEYFFNLSLCGELDILSNFIRYNVLTEICIKSRWAHVRNVENHIKLKKGDLK